MGSKGRNFRKDVDSTKFNYPVKNTNLRLVFIGGGWVEILDLNQSQRESRVAMGPSRPQADGWRQAWGRPGGHSAGRRSTVTWTTFHRITTWLPFWTTMTWTDSSGIATGM